MEGAARIEAQDTVNVSERFRMMASVDDPSRGRVKGKWYRAVPPFAEKIRGLLRLIISAVLWQNSFRKIIL